MPNTRSLSPCEAVEKQNNPPTSPGATNLTQWNSSWFQTPALCRRILPVLTFNTPYNTLFFRLPVMGTQVCSPTRPHTACKGGVSLRIVSSTNRMTVRLLFLNQELALVTGAVEAMVVDVQCIMPSLTEVAKCYHTLIITTSPKAKFPGAVHIEFSEERGLEVAKEIVRRAIQNYKKKNRGKVKIPKEPVNLVAGFSTEAILDALGGSLDPLIDAIKSGKIRGIAALVGCNNPKVTQDRNHVEMTKKLIENDVLVVQTGCSAIANAKAGLLVPEAADKAGEGLKEVCKALGIPPVLHMGSCVDISRILVVAAAIADALGVDISDLPVAGAAPEWMSEKAISIGCYVVASGIFTLLGTVPPILGSKNVVDLLTRGVEDLTGGKFVIEQDPVKGAELILEHIEKKRGEPGI